MEQSVQKSALFSRYPAYDKKMVDDRLTAALEKNTRKIIVLDDDPTGVQTVHGVYVYTDWERDSIIDGMNSQQQLFFILTNSRGFTEEQSKKMHIEIAERVAWAAKETGKEFILVSRSDSTLRGHYPLETETLRETLERNTGKPFDGEIIMPFFQEGGRYTANNVHYVADGETLIPAGQTEFALDKTFGYKSSNLCEWIEEKTGGAFPADGVVTVSLDELRGRDYDGICKKLMSVRNFGKVVVNAIDYCDAKVFVTALMEANANGCEFLFRTAAAFPKVAGGIPDKPLLTRKDLCNTGNKNGGMIVVGSHVKKTTRQLEALRQSEDITFVEFDQHTVVDEKAFELEIARVIALNEKEIQAGHTVAVYTRRERFDLNNGNKEDELRLAIKISDAVTSFVSKLNVRPNFIIAKGGITSSDVGTKGLLVKKALVTGQILQGVPVWLTGSESRFPDMPYVIFPGNVGEETALLTAVSIMRPDAADTSDTPYTNR